MPITRISQTHTGAPFMTPSRFFLVFCGSGYMHCDFRDGLPKRNLELDTENNKQRYGYLDPYVNVTGRPFQPRVNNWTYIMSENSYQIPVISDTARQFRLGMNQILQTMGKLQGIQVAQNSKLFISNQYIICLLNLRLELRSTSRTSFITTPKRLGVRQGSSTIL